MNKRLLIIPVFLLINLFYSKAQTLSWEWAKSPRAYGAAAGEGLDVATDSHGNVYFTGYWAGDSLVIGPITLYEIVNRMRVFVAKYDSAGNVLWARNDGAPAQAEVKMIRTDSHGNIYTTGIFSLADAIFGNDTLIHACPTDGFLIKYDSSGNILWARGSRGMINGGDGNRGVTIDPWGNVYITGYFGSDVIHFGNDSLVNAGQYNLFITKYDASGNEIWTKRAGGTYSDHSRCITSDAAGNLYITGSYGSASVIFGPDTLTHSQGFDEVFTAKYDSAGNALWARVGHGHPSIADYITISPAGFIYVVGHFAGNPLIIGTDTLLNYGNHNVFLLKYNTSGNLIWAKSFHGGIPYKLISEWPDNIYMSGKIDTGLVTIDTISFNMPINLQHDPTFIAKFNSNGNALWVDTIASGGDDDDGIALGPGGSFYMGGDFQGVNPFILGNDSLSLCNCTEAFFIAKANLPSVVDGVFRPIQINNSLPFPNPFVDKLNITIMENESSEIILYDISSRKILQQKFTNTISLNTSQLANGLYIYEIRNNNGEVRKGKVIKQ